MNHLGTIQLETERLTLRRFTVADAPAMFENWAKDPDVSKYLTWSSHKSVEDTRSILNKWVSEYNKPDYYHWGIVEKETDTLIGSTAVMKQDDKTKMVHIGYCIGKKWWRKGYASEALIRLVRFFFEEVGVNRIESRHDPRNPNSGKVMQKAGFRYEGTAIESDWNNQGICDAASYALLSRDYFCKLRIVKVMQATYRNAVQSDIDAVTDLSCELYEWLQMEREELFNENNIIFNDNRQKFILAYDTEKPIGFAHASLRSEYVNGTELDGVCGYLEGIYVKPEYRMNGIAAKLVRLCEEWAKGCGCREFASDCLLDNTDSYLFHLRIGFTETERCIFFKKIC